MSQGTIYLLNLLDKEINRLGMEDPTLVKTIVTSDMPHGPQVVMLMIVALSRMGKDRAWGLIEGVARACEPEK